MKRSESIVNLAAALCKFQGLAKNPPKTKIATIPTSKGTYTYKYADLGVIQDTIREPLAKCGLAYIQEPVNENGVTVGVRTIVFHESGEWMEHDPVYIPGQNASPQQVGSALTYARRYSLCMALGIVADEDDDAQAAQPVNGNGSTGKHPQQQRQGKPAEKKAPVAAIRKAESEKIKNDVQAQEGRNLDDWKQLADKNEQEDRFLEIAGKWKLTEKQQKAIIFGFTSKRSPIEVTAEEFKVMADWLENVTRKDIERAINEAVEAYQKGQASQRVNTAPITDEEIEELLGGGRGAA